MFIPRDISNDALLEYADEIIPALVHLEHSPAPIKSTDDMPVKLLDQVVFTGRHTLYHQLVQLVGDGDELGVIYNKRTHEMDILVSRSRERGYNVWMVVK